MLYRSKGWRIVLKILKSNQVTIIGIKLHYVIPFLKRVRIFESHYSFKFGLVSALFYFAYRRQMFSLILFGNKISLREFNFINNIISTRNQTLTSKRFIPYISIKRFMPYISIKRFVPYISIKDY